MKYIEKIKLQNFKRFQTFEVKLDKSLNIFIGENEAGKSSILTAISLVLTASRTQVDSIGLDRLINVVAVDSFMRSDRAYDKLPVLYAELYLNDHGNFQLDGRNNSENTDCHGLRMTCQPNDELSDEIKGILKSQNPGFPYDYYEVKFTTFAGEGYTSYKRYLKYLLIDTSVISTEYATRDYVARMYNTYVDSAELNKHQYEYRQFKERYKTEVLGELNQRVNDYQFAIKSDSKSNLKTDLTLTRDSIDIESKGKGNQCFIKTEFALRRSQKPESAIDIVLLEEPENHLSHVNMKKLVDRINDSQDKQLMIATHSNMISARLDLRRAILLHCDSIEPAQFGDLPRATAEFFIKAPNRGVLDFILSHKILLVEGDAEYILMEKMFEAVTGHTLEQKNVHVLSVGGVSFKRYLDIAKLLSMKVAVLRDNDKAYQENCVDAFTDYISDCIKVFSDNDNTRWTFEICLYGDNQRKCEALFAQDRRTLNVPEYMLKNKTEAAYKLLLNYDGLAVPAYIEDGIKWLVG